MQERQRAAVGRSITIDTSNAGVAGMILIWGELNVKPMVLLPLALSAVTTVLHDHAKIPPQQMQD